MYPNTECNQCGKSLRRRRVCRDTGDYCTRACADTHAEQIAEERAAQDRALTAILQPPRAERIVLPGFGALPVAPPQAMRCTTCKVPLDTRSARLLEARHYCVPCYQHARLVARVPAPAPAAPPPPAPSGRGGARAGAGRKPTGKPTRGHVVGVRLTDAELRTLTAQAEAAGEDLATWIRGVALAARSAR